MPIELPYGELHNWIGREFISDWVVVDQKRIDQFADVTGDHAWVHVDVERSTLLRGGTIAHGLLTLSLYPGLMCSLFVFTDVEHGLNYGFNSVRFTDIVPVDSSVRLRIEITEVSSRGEGVVVAMAFSFERKGSEKRVCVGESLGMLFPKKQS